MSNDFENLRNKLLKSPTHTFYKNTPNEQNACISFNKVTALQGWTF